MLLSTRTSRRFDWPEEVGFHAIYLIDHLYLSAERLAGYTIADVDTPYSLDYWTALAAITASPTVDRDAAAPSPLLAPAQHCEPNRLCVAHVLTRVLLGTVWVAFTDRADQLRMLPNGDLGPTGL